MTAAATMRAMRANQAGEALEAVRITPPRPGSGEVLVAVSACGVCRTDLHLVDGELADASFPVIPGHQIVGRVEERGAGVESIGVGDRVGVPWLGWTCGSCSDCEAGRENLCSNARFTGCHLDGGFAEAAVADARYCFPLPEAGSAEMLAPLLCAGLIGYRTLSMAADAQKIGIYGFGAAAHILAQILTYQTRPFWAFVRPGDDLGRDFALRMGARWAGSSDEPSPVALDAALIFAPVGALIPKALRDVRPGGTVVSGGIHMSDIPSFPYELLWGERTVRSVANLTRRDGLEFLRLATEIPIRAQIETYPLEQANQALRDLREGALEGSAVLVP